MPTIAPPFGVVVVVVVVVVVGTVRMALVNPNARQKKTPDPFGPGVWFEAPGDDLLSHGLSHTPLGAGAFHFRVRDGIGWDHTAMVARKAIGVAR